MLERRGTKERGELFRFSLSLSLSFLFFSSKKRKRKVKNLTCQFAVGGILHPPRVPVAVEGPVGLDACFVV